MEIISENNYKYGGFWRRFVASIIDGIVLWFIQTVITFLLTGKLYHNYQFNNYSEIPAEFVTEVFLILVVSIVLNVVYYAGMQSSSKQATIGKMCLDMKVVTTDGNRISFLRGIGRYFSKYLSAIILLIGYIMAAFDGRKQALHDKLADTMVIVERS